MHVDTFTDPLVECTKCHRRFRADASEPGLCDACGSMGEPKSFNRCLRLKLGR